MAYRITLYKLGRAAARDSDGLKCAENFIDPWLLAYTRRYWSRFIMKHLHHARIAIDEAVKYGGMRRKDALDTFRNGYYEVGIPLNRSSRIYNDARDDALREGC